MRSCFSFPNFIKLRSDARNWKITILTIFKCPFSSINTVMSRGSHHRSPEFVFILQTGNALPVNTRSAPSPRPAAGAHPATFCVYEFACLPHMSGFLQDLSFATGFFHGIYVFLYWIASFFVCNIPLDIFWVPVSREMRQGALFLF